MCCRRRKQRRDLKSVGSAPRENPLCDDEWKRNSVKWMKWEGTDAAATSGLLTAANLHHSHTNSSEVLRKQRH